MHKYVLMNFVLELTLLIKKPISYKAIARMVKFNTTFKNQINQNLNT